MTFFREILFNLTVLLMKTIVNRMIDRFIYAECSMMFIYRPMWQNFEINSRISLRAKQHLRLKADENVLSRLQKVLSEPRNTLFWFMRLSRFFRNYIGLYYQMKTNFNKIFNEVKKKIELPCSLHASKKLR